MATAVAATPRRRRDRPEDADVAVSAALVEAAEEAAVLVGLPLWRFILPGRPFSSAWRHAGRPAAATSRSSACRRWPYLQESTPLAVIISYKKQPVGMQAAGTKTNGSHNTSERDNEIRFYSHEAVS